MAMSLLRLLLVLGVFAAGAEYGYGYEGAGMEQGVG